MSPLGSGVLGATGISRVANFDNAQKVNKVNAVFYEQKDIYLEQLQIFDQRQIYANVSLATYVNNDKVAIKANTLHNLNLKKQRLLIELEQLKNGKI